MKKIALLVSMLIMLLIIVACAAANTPQQSPPPVIGGPGAAGGNNQAAAGDPTTNDPGGPAPDDGVHAGTDSGFTRGVVADHVYTSDFLGISFSPPDGWVFATQAEIAAVMDLGADFVDLDVENLLDVLAITTFYDMMAHNMLTGASASILVERLIFPQNRLNAHEYVDVSMGVMREVGFIPTDYSSVRNIGGIDWVGFETAFDIGGIHIYTRYYVTVQNEMARLIVVGFHGGSESPDEIISWFR